MAPRFALYYAAIFLVVGIQLPFWPAWLKWRGLDAEQISLLLSVGVWVRAIGNPLVAHFADRTGAHRRIIMIAATGGVLAYSCFAIVDGFVALFLVYIVASGMAMSLIPLGENLASRAAGEHGFDYGRVRLWGSISFILASYGAGSVIERTGDAAILWMMIAAVAIALLASFGLPERRARPAAGVRFPAVALLRRKPFLVFMGAVSLLQASHATLYVFGTIHWRAAGLSDDVIGALWAEGVIAEILLFAVSGAVVARLDPTKLMLLAAGAGIVRWAVLANTTDVVALVGVQWLHGLTFGAAHLAAIHYMLRNVPDHMSASAQSLYSGFATGLVTGLTMLLSGWLYAGFGAAAFYAMIALSAGGGAVALWLRRVTPGA